MWNKLKNNWLEIVLGLALVAMLMIMIFRFYEMHEDTRRAVVKREQTYADALASINSNEEVITYTQNDFGFNHRDKDIKLRVLAENRGYKVYTEVEKVIGGTFTVVVMRKEVK